jgi:hypothetical protein
VPRVELSAFNGKDIEPIFVGMSVSDCARAEQALDALAIDYAVKTESCQAHYCRHQLQSGGLGIGVIVPPSNA